VYGEARDGRIAVMSFSSDSASTLLRPQQQLDFAIVGGLCVGINDDFRYRCMSMLKVN